MAIIPCERCGQRTRSKLIYSYFAFASGLETRRRRVRLCEGCWLEIEPHLAQGEVTSTNTAWDSAKGVPLCYGCRQPIEQDLGHLYVTAYPTQDNREDYYFPVHGHCAPPEYWPRLDLAGA